MWYPASKSDREKEAGWSMTIGGWIGTYATITVILGFLAYAVVESPGYNGNLSLKKGDLAWFIGVYLLTALLFEWKRWYDNLETGGRVLWILLWLYVLAVGVALISLAPR